MANPHARAKTPRRKSAAGKRYQIRSVQRSNKGGDKCGGAASFSARIAALTGSIAAGDTAGINPICTGDTICAEDSPRAGVEALRWQQGATGAEAGEWSPKPVRWLVIPRCAMQQGMAAGAAETQTASPSTGAKSTVTSNQDAMCPRICMLLLYTRSQQG